MNNQVRLFVAIELPAAVKHEITRLQEELKKQDLFGGRYINPDQAHITMKFIGSVDTNQVDAIRKVLEQISCTPCVAQLDKVGLFCTNDFIKIVYLNVIAPTLPALAADLDKQLLPWCEPENREFVSHVTLARVKYVHDRQRMHDVVDALVVEPITFEINIFVLMRSVLGSDGPEYMVLQTYE